jgi:hypothetical protein
VPPTRLTFVHVLRSEWTKFWSVQSTWWTLLAMVVVIVGFGLIEAGTAKSTPGEATSSLEPAVAALMFGQLVMAILAVLVITGEFTSGEIKTSLLAAPGRWRMLAAKATIIAAIGFVITFVCVYATMLCSWPFIKSFATDDRFTGVGLRAVLGSALGIALVALMALGIGTLVRNGALAIGIVVLLTFILTAVFGGIHVHWMNVTVRYLPAGAIRGLALTPSDASSATAIFGFAKSLWVSLLWAFVPLLAGAFVLRRQDF